MRKMILISTVVLVLIATVFYLGRQSDSHNKDNDESGQWIKNSHEIQSLTSEDYADLEFLKPLLKDKRYVFLGESSHGVAEYNHIKVRMAKYLHKELGFDVIAFESPMVEASLAYAEKEDKDYTGKDLLQKSIFRIWDTREVSPLFNYIIENEASDPLVLAGFDVQPTFDAFGKFLSQAIKQKDPAYAEQLLKLEMDFGKKNIGVVNGIELTRDDVDYFRNGYQWAIDYVQANSEEMKESIHENPELVKIIQKALQDRIAYPERLYGNGAKDMYDVFKVRDEMMAENLEWLAEEVYPDKKFIIWGHNTHIRGNNNDVSYKQFGQSDFVKWNANSMFGNLPDKMKGESYNIGLYLYEGRIADNYRQSFVVNGGEKYRKDTLEYKLNKVEHDNFFLDISSQKENKDNKWMFEPIQALSAGSEPEKLIVKDSFAGLIFIKKVSPPLYYDY